MLDNRAWHEICAQQQDDRDLLYIYPDGLQLHGSPCLLDTGFGLPINRTKREVRLMANKKRKRKAETREGISVSTMVICLMLFFAWLSWAMAASAYFGALVEPVPVRGRAGGIALMMVTFATFLFNSLRIDALPDVFMNSLRHHPWHFILFGVLEASTAGFGLWVKWLERSLEGPRMKRNR